MVCLLSNRKKRKKEHVESISLVEGGQPSFYAENIPFSYSTIFSSSPTPKLISCRALPRLKMLSPSSAFRHDLYNHAKMPHPGQSHNVVIYMRTNVIHDQGGCEFDLPNCPFLSLISFYMPDIFMHALSCCVHDFSCYIVIWNKYIQKFISKTLS